MIFQSVRLFFRFFVILMFSAAALLAQQLTPQMMVDMRNVRQVAMQPQGDYIAYIVSAPRGEDETPGGAYSELWVVPRQGGQPRAYVTKPTSVRSLAWTPDGRRITYLAKRREYSPYTQVYAIALNGGESQQLSHAPGNITGYALSPDGRQLAYRMADPEPKDVKARKKAGFDQIVEDTWTTIHRVHVEDLSTGESRIVTRDNLQVWSFDWTPDGRQIIYQASERPFTDDRYMFTDNYIVPAVGGQGQKIYDTEGKLTLARLSPDGKTVAWLGATTLNDPYPGSLFVMPLSGGEPRNLIGDYPGTAESFQWKDAHTVLLVMIENTHKVLYRIDVRTGKRTRVFGGAGPVFGGISYSRDFRYLATAASTPVHPNEVYAGRLKNNSLTRLTHSNPELENMAFGAQEVVTWKGPDDWDISGILIKPAGYRPGQRYPLHVQVHGGPEAVRLDGWNTGYSRPLQALAQRGIMVLIPNYRGSIGKGVKFCQGDHRDLMGKEFEDILAGIDYLDNQGLIDPRRVSIGGGSYGGYMSAWAATKHSRKFAAAVVFVGIGNQISKAGMTDTPAENALVHWDLWLYDHYDLVWDRSPIKHVKNAGTPTLILHGQKDKRVPINQAFELYRALKYVDVETELVVYPREGHGNRERAHQLDLCTRMLGWYSKYLLGDAAK